MKTAQMRTVKITALFITLLIMASCNVTGQMGSGNVIRQERQVGSFNGIEVSGAFDVKLTQGTANAVVVEADDNLMDMIKTEVKGNTLVIENTRPVYHFKALKVSITFTELKSIDLSGAVNFESTGKLTLPELSIEGSGASDGKLDMDVKHLGIDCSGGSKLKLTGSATDVSVDLSGAGDLFAYEFLAENYNLDISGAGKADINVSKNLKVDISGAATVRYKGSPANISQEVSGAGSVRKAD